MIETLIFFAIAALIGLAIVGFILNHLAIDTGLKNIIWAVIGLVLLVVFLRIVGIF